MTAAEIFFQFCQDHMFVTVVALLGATVFVLSGLSLIVLSIIDKRRSKKALKK